MKITVRNDETGQIIAFEGEGQAMRLRDHDQLHQRKHVERYFTVIVTYYGHIAATEKQLVPHSDCYSRSVTLKRVCAEF
jgi:hypothetical protein